MHDYFQPGERWLYQVDDVIKFEQCEVFIGDTDETVPVVLSGPATGTIIDVEVADRSLYLDETFYTVVVEEAQEADVARGIVKPGDQVLVFDSQVIDDTNPKVASRRTVGGSLYAVVPHGEAWAVVLKGPRPVIIKSGLSKEDAESLARAMGADVEDVSSEELESAGRIYDKMVAGSVGYDGIWYRAVSKTNALNESEWYVVCKKDSPLGHKAGEEVGVFTSFYAGSSSVSGMQAANEEAESLDAQAWKAKYGSAMRSLATKEREKSETSCRACGGTGECGDCGGTGEDDMTGGKCRSCGGTGVCSRCKGLGVKTSARMDPKARIAAYKASADFEEVRCPECSGSGECRFCDGQGTVEGEEDGQEAQLLCSWCQGSGLCPQCGGAGYYTFWGRRQSSKRYAEEALEQPPEMQGKYRIEIDYTLVTADFFDEEEAISVANRITAAVGFHTRLIPAYPLIDMPPGYVLSHDALMSIIG